MNPSIPERLDSAVRALTYVILPALPKEASLAREQLQLVVGHLQISLAQYAVAPDFEAQEAQEFAALARTVIEIARGGAATQNAIAAMKATLDGIDVHPFHEQTRLTQKAIDEALLALALDGDHTVVIELRTIILSHGKERSTRDRKWFALMGFDPEAAGWDQPV
ncbi:MAG: hypothetical protein DI606_09390 [Sphingobium sp.]|uniref:hypothetical protein n=1 Tax=Sphingobium sp. TaxID=1912891 RepID=UPI000DB5B878|nr:hypothetical protein [Sphingobium sp.]PZU12381.1 MAG: hypothetical protein DI606_09390 [Sphingobium sp.]